MEIVKAEFVKGVIGDDYGMKDGLPHFAFLGRSNVGKSSLINSLTGKKKLARSNKMPGKTTEANFFRINDSFYIVDFPGYGYAKRSIRERNKMIKRIFWYIESSETRPRAVFLIIDVVVGLTALDKEMIKILKENEHRVFIIANKIDKLSKEAAGKKFASIKKEAGNISVLLYSAKTNEEKNNLIKEIESFLLKD